MPTPPPELCLELMGLVSVQARQSPSLQVTNPILYFATRAIYALKIFQGVYIYVKSTNMFFNLKNKMITWYRMQYIPKFITFSICCLQRIFKY